MTSIQEKLQTQMCIDAVYAVKICGQDPQRTLCTACQAAEEINRLNRLVSEMLPYLLTDVDNGVRVGPPPLDHDADNCSDCQWYEESVQLKHRILSGEFGPLPSTNAQIKQWL